MAPRTGGNEPEAGWKLMRRPDRKCERTNGSVRRKSIDRPGRVSSRPRARLSARRVLMYDDGGRRPVAVAARRRRRL